MSTSNIIEINLEDIFADINFEVEEIESILKITCCALKSPKYDQPSVADIDNTLFSICGKLSNLKNNFRIMEEIVAK